MDEPQIIYERDDMLIINKPAGWPVHPDGHQPGPFLTDWLLKYCPPVIGVGENEERPGIVHRLDKDTSGVMVVAKTAPAYQFLKEQFKGRAVQKIYLAVVKGEFKAGVGFKGKIDWPIGRSLKDARVRVASHKAYGELRPAETAYEVLAQKEDYALLKLEPLTGRTHQLRAHLKALQHPIVCDALYGTGEDCPAGLKRQALHAWRLRLALPSGGAGDYEAPPPPDLAALLAFFNFKC